MKGICLIAHGGGVVAAYHAGVAKAIKEKFGLDKIDRIIASSGAAATYSYLVSGQEELIIKIWLEIIKDRRFINFFKFPPGKGIINIDFLINEIVKNKYPLDLSSLKNSKIQLEICVTDADNGQAKFFSKNDNIDFYELLKASCAIPYFYGRKIALGKKYYYDGTIGGIANHNIAKDEKNILIVLTTPPKPVPKLTIFRKILRHLLIGKESILLQKAVWDMMNYHETSEDLIKRFGLNKNIVIVRPTEWLPIWRIDFRVSRLKKVIEQGYKDVIENKSLEKFFERL